MIETVLVPVDRGDPADRAFEFALERYPDANVTVLYVISPAEARYLTGNETRFRPKFDEAVEEATAFLDEYVERGKQADVTVEADYTMSYEGGRTARAILDYLDDHSFNHIVMGSHGRRGTARIMLGSVAEKVVRQAEIPVTVVR